MRANEEKNAIIPIGIKVKLTKQKILEEKEHFFFGSE